MKVVETIIMRRRDLNGLQKEQHKSPRFATAMYHAARPTAASADGSKIPVEADKPNAEITKSQ